MEPNKKIHKNILNAITSYKSQITGNAATINVIKNGLDQLREQRKLNKDLQRFIVRPYEQAGAQNFQILKVAILGRNNYHYQGLKINTYIFFFDGYPTTKPVIYFEDLTNAKGQEIVFQHMNVFSSGKLCLEAIQTNYNPSMSLVDILRSLEAIIIMDNIKSPANGKLAAAKRDNMKEYNRILSEQSKFLQKQTQDEMIDESQDDDD